MSGGVHAGRKTGADPRTVKKGEPEEDFNFFPQGPSYKTGSKLSLGHNSQIIPFR